MSTRASSINYRSLPIILTIHLILNSYALVSLSSLNSTAEFLVPGGEFLAALALIVLSRRREHPGIAWNLWGAALLLGLQSYRLVGELFYRYFYLLPFSLLMDSKLIPGFISMILGAPSLPALIIDWGAMAITVLIFLGTGRILAGIIHWSMQKRDSPPIPRSLPLVLSTMALMSVLIFPSASAGAGMVIDGINALSLRNKTEAAKLPGLDDVNDDNTAIENEDDGRNGGSQFAFPAIEDMDIHFFVIESYGTTLFMRDEYIEAIRATYDDIEPRLKRRGWKIYSGLVRSPAFGGRSWLADASLLTGTQLSNQSLFEAEIADGRPAALLELLGERGYHRTYAAPGTEEAPDDWKIAYPFEEYLLRNDFAYKGPYLNFGVMSDQYFLNRVGQDHLDDQRRDFALYLMVSSHTPFRIIPQYKEDWDFSRGGREYKDGHLSYFENNWLSGGQLAEGYLGGIDYSLRTIEGFLETHLEDRGMILIIGDHQPRKPVSVSTAGYAVPFHILIPREFSLSFPEDWDLSEGMLPPPVPADESGLPELAAIPGLIIDLIE